jgi:hypothetical protein
VVHARRVGDKELTFIVSGRLWRNSLVMQDKETGTYWSHVNGEAIEGPLKGTKLTMIPAVHTTWGKWRARHPETTLLAKSREVRSSQYTRYFENPEETGLFRSRRLNKRMPAKTLVHGLTIGLHALAVPDDRLEEGSFAQALLGEEPVIIARGLDGGVRAFSARRAGKVMKFEKGDKKGTVRDTQTGSSWNLERGAAVTGELAGQRLEEIPVILAFWFAWSSFYPNTEVL